MVVEDRPIDVVAEGYDAGIRFGDAVPAFMLIPIPRPRRDAAAAEPAAADPADTEQAAA